MAFFNPFCSEEAISHSNYCSLQKNHPSQKTQPPGPLKQTTRKVAGKLTELLDDSSTPKQLLGHARRQNCCFGVYPQLGSTKATAGLCRDLARFLHEYKDQPAAHATFMAVFTTSSSLSEADFEKKVAEQISLLQQAAEPFYCLPESEKEKAETGYTCVAFGGRLLKVISLYRNSSGGHLKFDYPMLAFSLQPAKKAKQASAA
ncbi:YqcI/YcgG family protein [Cesiribacter andamanensis]|uniref:Uncharacterized protein n=1 Tax=Cesiribacter andamanensis AMV16 TaxID=1279009 RepID=M7N2B3_9BACT|nr:YqcI/YcgG family protein [Cesiribacter andamanensis]EMR02793.1 hypothetical protein ADICEAN_02068 [Cesiribacter andamanensis AMV16]